MIHLSDQPIAFDAPRAEANSEDFVGATGKKAPNAETGTPSRSDAIASVLAAAQRFADEVASRPNHGDTGAPLGDLARMAELALLTAPLPVALGGLGLGTEPQGHLPLLKLLATVGGADLVLGRLYEGHVNALILTEAYGTPQQLARAAQDAHDGLLFAVWNTGGSDPLRLIEDHGIYVYQGIKTFASGATFVRRPIITADLPHRGWQMTLPRMESPAVRSAVVFDREAWNPLGMQATESYGIDLTGAAITHDDLIGAPEDFYQEPLFRGGAIRFAAVHAGAVLRLHRMFAEWLLAKGRGDDPYQVARLGQLALHAQEAILWIERAALLAEDGLSPDADKLQREQMTEFANMTRLAVERSATASMQLVIAGVGAHGLLQPGNFERVIRNLTMYLRQPAPDHTLAEVGRAALRKSGLRSDGAANGMWHEEKPKGSLPPHYFESIYERSRDPWNFETSAYEADKYSQTLESLPLPRYAAALEVGCSIGVLTERLAIRCDSLLSVDVSELALDVARERCAWLPQVEFKAMQIPSEMPDRIFDLIVISEVGYYWHLEDLDRAATLMSQYQRAGGHLVLVHFTEFVPDYPLTGDQVHERWLSRKEWRVVAQQRHARYRLDVLERLP